MLFTDNIVLVDEFKSRVNAKLEIRRNTLEDYVRTKIEYMK